MPFASNDGVRIHYEVDGSGPPVVLAHGFSRTLESWYENGYAQVLSKKYRLVLVDSRGFGKSDKPHKIEDYGPGIIAADYTAVMDRLRIEKAHFFGYSMGGRFAFQAMARYAKPRLLSLIIGGATPYGTVTDEEREETELRIRGLELAVQQGMEAYIESFYEKLYKLGDKERKDILDNDPDALLAIRLAYERWPSAADLLPKLDIPVLVYCGEKDPRFPMAKECVTHMPKAVFVPFPRLDHPLAMHTKKVLPYAEKFLEGTKQAQAPGI